MSADDPITAVPGVAPDRQHLVENPRVSELWGSIQRSMEDLAHAAQRTHEMAEAVKAVTTSAYASNAEMIPTPDAERADAEMLARMLDHLDEWMHYLEGNRDDVRQHLADLGGAR